MATDYVTKRGESIRATRPIRSFSGSNPCRTYTGTERNTDGYVDLTVGCGQYDKIDRRRYDCIERIGEGWK